MDQETEESTQGQSTPVTDDALEPEVSLSVKEEPEDEPSAVHSNNTSGSPNTVQPVPNKAGSLNRSNSCQRCAAVFMLPRSLTVHMQTVHGETDRTKLPAASKRREDTGEDAKQTPSELGRSSPQGSDNSREEFTMSPHNFTIKLEPTWSEDEEQDEPSAVYSTVQPLSDNTSGSLLSLNITSHVCPHCLDSFVLFSSLELHMATFHGETLRDTFPVFPTSYYADSVRTGGLTQGELIPVFPQMPSGQERLSTQVTDDSRDDSVTSSKDFTIKLEPAWSMKEEPQDEPSAVYSTVQPMSDNTSGSLLSLNSSHVCQRCFASFVLFSSLELHLATFHGESPHGFLVYSGNNGVDVGYHHGSKVENGGNSNIKKAVKGRGEKVEDSDSDSDRTDQERIEWDHAYHLSRSSMPSTATGKKSAWEIPPHGRLQHPMGDCSTPWKIPPHGRLHPMEDPTPWKIPPHGRLHPMEDCSTPWKIPPHGRLQHPVEDWHPMEDCTPWKIAPHGRFHPLEDSTPLKIAPHGRLHPMEDCTYGR
ncbi:hypothetical protein ACOMHN_023840 [Nucella lapillus]